MLQPVAVFDAEPLVGVPEVGYAYRGDVHFFHAYSIQNNLWNIGGEEMASLCSFYAGAPGAALWFNKAWGQVF
jgi:hypothetical protein